MIELTTDVKDAPNNTVLIVWMKRDFFELPVSSNSKKLKANRLQSNPKYKMVLRPNHFESLLWKIATNMAQKYNRNFKQNSTIELFGLSVFDGSWKNAKIIVWKLPIMKRKNVMRNGLAW